MGANLDGRNDPNLRHGTLGFAENRKVGMKCVRGAARLFLDVTDHSPGVWRNASRGAGPNGGDARLDSTPALNCHDLLRHLHAVNGYGIFARRYDVRE
jgi:hypothetical protein